MAANYDPEKDGPVPELQPKALQRIVGEAVIDLLYDPETGVFQIVDREEMATRIGEVAIDAIGNPALSRLTPGEPLFVLRGRDPCSIGAIHHWISQATIRGCPPEKLRDAEARIVEMHNWPVRKAPD